MEGSSTKTGLVDRIAAVATLAVALFIVGLFALSAKAGTPPSLAATTVAMAYRVGPVWSKAIRHLQPASVAPAVRC